MAKEITIDIHNGITEQEVSDDSFTYIDPFTNDKNMVKAKRNELLNQCDWTQTVDAPLTDAQKFAWAEYRQQLRDLPATITTLEDINNLVWPTQPE